MSTAAPNPIHPKTLEGLGFYVDSPDRALSNRACPCPPTTLARTTLMHCPMFPTTRAEAPLAHHGHTTPAAAAVACHEPATSLRFLPDALMADASCEPASTCLTKHCGR